MKLNKMNNWLKNDTSQLLKKILKSTIYFSFKDNIWGADLGGMLLISNFDKVTRFL